MQTLCTQVTQNTENLIYAFKQFVHQPNFPCVGAKSALAHNSIEFCIAGDMLYPVNDRAITKQLQNFAANYNSENLFMSFVVIFDQAEHINEVEFEHYLWERLQAFHNIDRLDFGWDKAVSSDTESPDFSMSIGGKGFYVVGLHPNSSRVARRFSRPALIFNLHSQFEMLREKGKYAKLRESIIKRDLESNGSVNPMLAAHGDVSEARQYSGRAVSDEWKCPFRRLMKGK